MPTRQSRYWDRSIGFDKYKNGNEVRVEVLNNATSRSEFCYLSPEVALELADFILANVERPKKKTTADQIRELAIGTRFTFNDHEYVKVSDKHVWSTDLLTVSVASYELDDPDIEVIE